MTFTTGQDVSDALEIPFSEQQLTAITAPLSPGVIIAGAGSGKTTVMAARVVWLVGSGAVRPEAVLGLTFTRKAAAELSGRIRAALAKAGLSDPTGVDDAGEQLVMTYDAFAARLVSDHGLLVGVENDPRMITGASRFRLASRVVASAAGPFEYLSRLRPQSVTERLLALDAEMTAHLVSRERLGEHTRAFISSVDAAPSNPRGDVYASLRLARAAAEERLELAALAASYAELKRSLGYVEFADQMAVAARLAAEAPSVSAAVRDQFRVVLLDEYQDTSSAQAALLRGLFSGSDPEHGRGHPVTAVGDPCQAIYGWRGAAASNILAFAADFPDRLERPARRFALTVNRRSGQEILDAANDLARGLQADPAMNFEGARLTLVAPVGAPSASLAVASFHTWPEEVAFVADRIVAAKAAGEVPSWSEVAVLTRRNQHIGALHAALEAREVPVEIVGLGGLLSVPEIVEIVSTLTLLDDVTANPELIRLLTSSRWAIGAADLEVLGRRAAELAGQSAREPAGDLLLDLGRVLARGDRTATPSLLEAVEDPGEHQVSDQARERLAAFAAELRWLRRHSGEPVLDLLRRVITTLGLEVELASNGAPLSQLQAFVDAVADYVDVDGEASLSGLLAFLAAERDHGTGLERAVISANDSVKLLTVHRAKGLEWHLVLLPGLAADVFPTLRVTSNYTRNAAAVPGTLRGDVEAIPHPREITDRGLKEYAEALTQQAQFAEDRLAYVAATRAKRVLVASTHTWSHGLVKPRSPSAYFLTLAAHATILAAAPEPGSVNPLDSSNRSLAWPALGDPDARARRASVAAAVDRARETLRAGSEPSDDPATLDDLAVVAGWDDAATQLINEALRGAGRSRVVPDYLSVTGVVSAVRGPERYADDLRRPMPRPASRRQQVGSRFHQWIELRFAAAPALDPDGFAELAADLDDPAFQALTAAFCRGQFAERRPFATESPFALMLGDTLIRGRIDAVFEESPGFLVVDWKTGAAMRSDPLQLALYRLAWAELRRVDPRLVRAAFYDVRADRLLVAEDLPDREALTGLVAGLRWGA
ncbi:MAG: ATP-dependent DNA helicase [Micropruina sp.]